MSTLLVRLCQTGVKLALEPPHYSRHLWLDTCIVLGYFLSVMAILPTFVLFAWLTETLNES